MKNKLVAAIVLALVTFTFVGCSKDDNPSQTDGSIDAAVGTFKGTLDITDGRGQIFDQTIVVTKVSNERVKVTVGDASLNLPAREFNVTNNANYSIQAAATEPGAAFLFEVANKTIVYLAKPMAQGDVTFKFDGAKQ